MTQTYEEYLKDVAENGDSFSKPKKKKERSEIKIIGSNGNWIHLKPVITLSYNLMLNMVTLFQYKKKIYQK